jgi:hypothetical protein
MSAKKVAIGDFIGYGTSFLAEEKWKLPLCLSVILMVIAVR